MFLEGFITINALAPSIPGRLGLRAGDRVFVRSKEDIQVDNTVYTRVDRLINEHTGKMMTMKNPCIQLEDVYCRAECTATRLGCPRGSNTYWREIWLKRISVPARSVESACEVAHACSPRSCSERICNSISKQPLFPLSTGQGRLRAGNPSKWIR
jgi:hypothetical protein